MSHASILLLTRSPNKLSSRWFARARGSRITPGADEAFDVRAFVGDLRARGITPHVARDDRRTTIGARRRSAVDARGHPPPGLHRQPAHPQADRGRLRLDQDHRRPVQDAVPRRAARRMDLHPRRRRRQPDPDPRAAGASDLPQGRRYEPAPNATMARGSVFGNPAGFLGSDPTGGESRKTSRVGLGPATTGPGTAK